MPLFIPSPSINGFPIGPLTIRFYALCLLAGIIAAFILGLRQWKARGGTQLSFETCVFWAVPMGIVGARIYHVLTHAGDYFGPDAQLNPFYIWEGGIAIFGAIGLGALGAWIGAKRTKIKFAALADSLAPGIALGQCIGRFGNWFNQELYGMPIDAPWGLEIDRAHRVPGFEEYSTFHPTFLYESIWNLFVVGVLLIADKRWTLGRGKVFALYVALYGFGRFFTEAIRLDYSYDTFGPIRFNQFVAMLICVAGVALLLWLVKFRPGREDFVDPAALVADDLATQTVDDGETGEAGSDGETSGTGDDVESSEAGDNDETSGTGDDVESGEAGDNGESSEAKGIKESEEVQTQTRK